MVTFIPLPVPGGEQIDQIPAFRILTDRTLKAFAETRPETAQELLAIPGIGLKTTENYGTKLFRILQS